jgi:hypothetical protein
MPSGVVTTKATMMERSGRSLAPAVVPLIAITRPIPVTTVRTSGTVRRYVSTKALPSAAIRMPPAFSSATDSTQNLQVVVR